MANTLVRSPMPDVHGPATDQQLLERFVADRDETAFTRLVERHGRTIFGVCRRVLRQDQDAEDAFQAVFIVFARKASSIRKGEAVGSWLYSVAYRIAMRARQSVARRQEAEKKAPEAPAKTEPWGEAALREMQRLLDEEVQRLDEKHRAPFVLCCLEGMSKSEAAAELGWKEGTISGRLAQARKLLQNRLARRGVTLSAALTAIALTQSAVAAAPPVLAVTAGGGASSSAIALAEGFVSGMGATKLKAALAAFLAMTMTVTAAGVTAFNMGGNVAEQPEPPAPIHFNDPETFVPPPSPLMKPIDEQVLSLAFSPDGKRLATAGARWQIPGQFMIWDVATKKEIVRVRGMSGIRGIAFSPDGKTVACGSFSGAVSVRDAETGKETHVFQGHKTGVNAVAYSADGNWLVSAGLDNVAKLWDMKNHTEKKVFLGHTDQIFSVAYFKHGKSFVTCGKDASAKIWDIATGAVKHNLIGHKGGIECVTISPDDAIVATGGWDQTIKLWNAATGMEIATLPGNERGVYALVFSHDGSLLASATQTGTLRVWDMKTRQSIKHFGRHNGPIWSLSFAKDTNLLASGSSDSTAKLWDIDTGNEVATLNTGQLTPVLGMAQTPDGSAIAIATGNSFVQVRDAASGNVRHTLGGHTDNVTCVAISHDGKTLASGSRDKSVKIWDLEAGKELRTLTGHEDGVLALAFAPNGQLASAGDLTVKLWNPAENKELKTLRGHTGPVHALAYSADGAVLASGSSDRSIRLWDPNKDDEPRLLEGHALSVRALAFSPNGDLASASDDLTIKLWNVAVGKERSTLHGHVMPALSLAFSRGGRTLVSGGLDKNTIIWNAATGKPRTTLRVHNGPVNALLIHPEGDYLLSGSLDATILRWKSAAAATTAPARVLAGAVDGVWFAQYSPANDRLATGGADGTVTLWTRGLAPALAPFAEKGGAYWDAAFSADGRSAVLGGETKIDWYDLATGQVTKTIPMAKQVRSIAFSPDRKYFAATTGSWKAADADYETTLFDAATGAELAKLGGKQGMVFKAVFSPDSKTIVASARDKTIKVWDLPSCKLRGTLTGLGAPARSMAFLPNGTLVSVGWDKSIRFWDLQKMEQTDALSSDINMTSLAISPDGTLLAVAESPSEGTTPSSVRIWDVAAGKQKLELKGHSSRIVCLAFTNDGRGVVAGGGQKSDFNEMSYFDLASGQLRGSHKIMKRWWFEGLAINIDDRRVVGASVSGMAFFDLDFLFKERTINAHSNIASCGVFANGGATLITSGWDRTIQVWNTRTGELKATLKGHAKPVRALAMLRDGNTLASAGEDSTVKLWDLPTAKEKATLEGHGKMVYSLAVSPDGKTLASGGGDHRVLAPAELLLWDVDTLKQRKAMPSIERTVWSIAYSPDGKMMAGSVAQGYVRVWSADTGAVLANLPVDLLRPVAFSPDGKVLAVGDSKAPSKTEPGFGRVRFFDTKSWKQFASLDGHKHIIFTVAFSPDGQSLASAGQDGTVQLHAVPSASGDTRVVTPAKVAPNPLTGVVDPNQPGGEQSAAGSFGWPIFLTLGIVLMILTGGAMGLVLLVWRGRRRATTTPVKATPTPKPKPAEEEAVPLIAFGCAACGKKLKVKAASAGKKVKCPGCSEMIAVPKAKVGAS